MKKSKTCWNNPIITSEMKVKMRSWRAPAGMLVYLVCMLVFMVFFASIVISSNSYYSYDYSNIGSSIFLVLSFVQFFIIVLVAPSTTAGAISSEREKQTLDLLLCTRMSPFQIVLGKCIAPMSWIFLMIVASIPFYSVAFLFGGVTPWAVISVLLFYIPCALFFGCIGIFYSVIFKKTITSTVLSYLTIFFWEVITVVIGLLQIYLSYETLNRMPSSSPITFLLNPFMAFLVLLDTHTSWLTILGGILPSAPGPAGFLFWDIVFLLGMSLLLLIFCAMLIDPLKLRRGKRKA